MKVVRKLVRVAIAALGGIIGYQLFVYGWPFITTVGSFEGNAVIYGGTMAVGILSGGGIAFLLAPTIINSSLRVIQWSEAWLQKIPVYDVITGALGLIVGLIIANLLGFPLSRVPFIGFVLPLIANLGLGYLGMVLAVKRKEEIHQLIGSLRPGAKEKAASVAVKSEPKILDTSVIIDGRIADICRSGFIEGDLIIAGFVLEELRHIADSSDLLKRNRGRRGLDILNKIQKELEFQVKINETDYDDIAEVDSKLVRLAQEMKGKILTNDFNLNKVAELQGVPVLNINELANAVKPVVLPGEEMLVHLIKNGKEAGQGVAYLDDGTMIVVDGGKRHIGKSIDVLVTSVLQTAAGRMIFAKPKAEEKAQ
ncbi:MAG: PIN/TRAM domain-containing protein [Firmicutes bacterium]|nr:PIN/TRAM domain-containing protein [Bacillota bacterium]